MKIRKLLWIDALEFQVTWALQSQNLVKFGLLRHRNYRVFWNNGYVANTSILDHINLFLNNLSYKFSKIWIRNAIKCYILRVLPHTKLNIQVHVAGVDHVLSFTIVKNSILFDKRGLLAYLLYFHLHVYEDY